MPLWRSWRRPRSSDGRGSFESGQDRPAALRWWIAAAVLVLALAAALALGTGAIRLASEPPPIPPPAPVTALAPVSIPDWAVELSVPATWTQVEYQCCDYGQFSGQSPEGSVTVGNESPYSSSVCDPECHRFELPFTIPFSVPGQLAALKTEVATIAGTDAWTEVPADVLPQVDGGKARLEATHVGPDGRDWRTVYIVGMLKRNAVTFSWSQPVEAFDQDLLDDVLASVNLLDAPVYSDGDLIPVESERFSMPISGNWQTPDDQPTLDGTPLSGVRSFSEGRVMVSIGERDGTLGWCDPDCVQLTGMTSVEALESAIRGDRSLGPAETTTLGGEPALGFGTNDPVERRYVVAVHDGRPVALMIDVGEWSVAPGITDEMIAGFAFIDPPPPPAATQTFSWEEGGVALDLPDGWQRIERDDGSFYLAFGEEQRLWVFRGDEEGAIQRCIEPAAPWDACETIKAASLEELAATVMPKPIDDHGVPAPGGTLDAGTLGGEPSAVVHIQGYEYPANGGQSLTYITTIHDRRPYIVRIWTSAESGIVDEDAVITGFRFVD